MKDTGTKAFVLDASIAGAWALPDETSSYAEDVLQRLKHGEAWVPSLWSFEIANLLEVSRRRRRISDVKSMTFRMLISFLPISVDEPSTTQLLNALMPLSRDFNLSPYDASYLELALRRQIPLATDDKRLQEAAKAAGVLLA